MALVINCTKDEQQVKALGNWFTFKPGQIKILQDNIGRFLSLEKKQYGLMELPEAFTDPDYAKSPEGIAIMEQVSQEGLRNYIDFHRKIVENNQVSLRRDLEQANIKADPATYASEGELASMRIVAKYAQMDDDAAQKRIEEVRALTEKGKKK